MRFSNTEFKLLGSFALNHKMTSNDKINGLDINDPFITEIREHQMHITYPIRDELMYRHKLSQHDSYTIEQLVKEYVKVYKYIYRVEEQTMTTEVKDDMSLLNRARSDGVYHIYGHSINQLWIERITLFLNVKKRILYSFVSVGS